MYKELSISKFLVLMVSYISPRNLCYVKHTATGEVT